MNTQIQNPTAQLIVDQHFRDYHGGYFSVLVSAEETNGAMSIVDMTMPKGSEPSLICARGYNADRLAKALSFGNGWMGYLRQFPGDQIQKLCTGFFL
ncbi:hypothetical protein [Mucilaginibacter ginkgonis]|uniref:Uncharacterized protein n=1 Tax=Mucilaginibacter ginkgonis TaxID=2682091 RepID=A0A6I4INH1_9SPHI|nr:hypothetical protein [Mucilaginibacter ginkgonis]QQL49537.1 hypothetical protein GO620_015390 [Mucilaginibacter ginkgonis]